MRLTRLAAALSACVVAGAVPGVPSIAPAQASSCPTPAGESHWELAPAPSGLVAGNRASWQDTAALLAVDPVNARRLYTSTDGATIRRSTDGGCTWRTVFRLADIP